VSLDDDCVTISMGFRAPSFVSMCAAYVEYVSSAFIDRTDMFADPLLTLQPSIGVVTADAIQSIQVGIQDKVSVS
jgi:50S ribosomal protein L16 3-hydroxylase